jgi:hypothetical protein
VGALDALGAIKLLSAKTLVVATLDRLGQDELSLAVVAYLLKHPGATLSFAKGTGRPTATSLRAGRHVAGHRTLDRALDAYDRVHAALEARLRAHIGPPRRGPRGWGYRSAADGTIEVDEDEQRVVAIVRHMHATGNSLREIVVKLREMGVVSRRGKPIGLTRVFEMASGAASSRPTRR